MLTEKENIYFNIKKIKNRLKSLSDLIFFNYLTFKFLNINIFRDSLH